MMSTAKNRLSTASQSSLRSLSGGSPWSPPEKHYDDYDDTVLNRAGSTLAVPYFGPKNGVHLKGRARHHLGRLARANQRLFVHWEKGIIPAV